MDGRSSLVALALLLPIGGARAQYIARKLDTNGWPQTPNAVSGNRAVGTFGSSATRLREDAMLWNVAQGAPGFPESPVNSAYEQISGDWVVRSQFDFSLLQVTQNRSYAAQNLVTGQAFELGTSASANNSQGYVTVFPNLREGWAIANTHQRAIAIGPYDIYTSKAINLATGQTYSFSWDYAAFSYLPRQILDISGGRALVNLTATGFGFLDLPTGAISNITTGLASVAGMSGNYLVGARAGTGAAALYEIGSNTTRDLGSLSGLTGAGVVAVGANQSVGNGQVGGSTHALLWDNATGAAVDLHGFLPSGYGSSTAAGIDKNFADGPLLVRGATALGTLDSYALRRFDGALIQIDTSELATFNGNHTQTGGTVINAGIIQWTSPSGIYFLNGGALMSHGSILGGIDNGGGALSGGGGALRASGGYVQGGGGTLLLGIGGGSDFDTFTFGGDASLGGALEIALTGGFVPAVGQSFSFFSALSRTGTWDRVVSPGYRWDIAYSGSSATVTYRGLASVSAPEPSSLALLLLAPLALWRRRRYNRA